MPEMLTWRDILNTLGTIAIQNPHRIDDPAIGWFDCDSKPVTVTIVEAPELGYGEERLILLPLDEIEE